MYDVDDAMNMHERQNDKTVRISVCARACSSFFSDARARRCARVKMWRDATLKHTFGAETNEPLACRYAVFKNCSCAQTPGRGTRVFLFSFLSFSSLYFSFFSFVTRRREQRRMRKKTVITFSARDNTIGFLITRYTEYHFATRRKARAQEPGTNVQNTASIPIASDWIYAA